MSGNLGAFNQTASCSGKARFDSPRLAYEVARRYEKGRRGVRNHRKERRDVYRCPYCGGWHLGRP